MTQSLSPVSVDERIQLLDVLRGFAIFGMFTVNMTVDIWWGDSLRDIELSLPDFLTVVWIDLFTNGKFITIFTFLYGVGFYIQMQRTKGRNANQVAFHVRRSCGLLLIGLAAMALTVPAWILIDYAVFGLALLLFRNQTPRIILISAIIIMLFAKLMGGILPDIRAYQKNLKPIKQSELVIENPDSNSNNQKQVLAKGNFRQISLFGLSLLWKAFTDWEYYAGELDLLGLMLIGLFVARKGAVYDPALRQAMASKAWPWLITIGFSGCLVFVLMRDFSLGNEALLAHKLISNFFKWPMGMPVLGLGYVAAITLLYEKQVWKKLLTPFAAVGRTALTNYLFTGLVAAFISFSWGLGFYGKMTVWQGLLLVVIIFPLQVLASNWWVNKFRFGPVEWLWRSLTYGSIAFKK